ncbi:MAG TPA: Gfo/Idh/MocA family oxidoreductase, partial [Candidatus Synoicihabitans sp.]|nr:Gfo/Idh/MocA family oxidoreductase [Candidatus Synoicihabitans sp.]
MIEGEALVAAARKYHRVVQVNMQRRSSPFIHRARDEYIQSGRLGAIGLVEAYSYLPGRPTGPIDRTTPPEHLDFELWTGPAPLLPFAPRMADRGWRAFMEYGNGQIGDLGVHTFDYVRFLLELGWPNAISSTGGVYVDRHGDATISDTQRSVFHYPNLDVSWEHRTWGVSPIPLRHWTDQWGARIIGEKGTLNVTTLGYEFRPADGGASEGVHLLSSTRNLEYIDFNRFNEAFDEA